MKPRNDNNAGSISDSAPRSIEKTIEDSMSKVSDADIFTNKIRFWKWLTLVNFLISIFIVAGLVISLNNNPNVGPAGIAYAFFIGYVFLFFSIFLIIALVRVIVLSSKRGKHLFRDYSLFIVGLFIVISPFIIAKITIILDSTRCIEINDGVSLVEPLKDIDEWEVDSFEVNDIVVYQSEDESYISDNQKEGWLALLNELNITCFTRNLSVQPEDTVRAEYSIMMKNDDVYQLVWFGNQHQVDITTPDGVTTAYHCYHD